ncbi:optineurin isoform X2 [Crotalus tigris]|uniref:optineurin isoform X2 n=1 Tax=Crotalus tigris TaxID=88082 RepID=UPI00192F25F1|nr:optineurin isoform X2 [Crotalus tigris]
MSKKPLNIPVVNGQPQKTEVENGHPNLMPPTLSTSSVEEMVQQMKELITENNELKEAMRQRNQAMKDRFEELSAWKEKLKEEREFYESKFKDARQCLAAKCLENESLHQKLQSLGEKGERGTQEGAAEGALKQPQEVDVKRINESAALYVRTKSMDEAKKYLEREELTVSQLLHSLRTETQKRETLENKMQELKDKCQQLLSLKKKTDEKGTQTEQEAKKKEERSESVGSEVETLNLQVSALFRELQETHAKLKEADVIQKKLHERCQILEREHPVRVGDLDEKQQLLYTIKKLELQVESMQSEIKLEQAKTNDEKAKFSSLQDAYSKLVKELTEALQTVEELKGKEAQRIDQASLDELIHKLDLAEKALAAKQLQIDKMKQTLTKQEEELETVAVLRAQMEVYYSDFHAERAAREKIHEEKEQLATQLAYFLSEKEERGDLGRCSLAEMQTRHGTRLPSDQGAEDQNDQQQSRDIPIHSCPKCGIILPDIDTLQIHVMDCIT